MNSLRLAAPSGSTANQIRVSGSLTEVNALSWQLSPPPPKNRVMQSAIFLILGDA
jgi:hypothetical protein